MNDRFKTCHSEDSFRWVRCCKLTFCAESIPERAICLRTWPGCLLASDLYCSSYLCRLMNFHRSMSARLAFLIKRNRWRPLGLSLLNSLCFNSTLTVVVFFLGTLLSFTLGCDGSFMRTVSSLLLPTRYIMGITGLRSPQLTITYFF